MTYRHHHFSANGDGGEAITVLMVGRSFAEFGMRENAATSDPGLYIAREHPDLEGLERRIHSRRPDVLLFNGDEERDRGRILGLLRSLRKSHPALKCVVVATRHEMEFLVTAVQHGARGLIARERLAEMQIGDCIRSVHAGQIWIPNSVLVEVLNAFSKSAPLVLTSHHDSTLTPREHEVMNLVTQGLSNKEIATLLQVTESTVKKYVYEVFNKTGASSRVELVLRSVRSAPAA